ncbi:type II secretion system protein N [Ramlibacter humi]|uniref:Type II secretion system protein N n=1 Tax=Ramlibacter humi TaxID=2530451 RepID=A0A4Z0BZ31_9BURK|nr:type II secretion system protein N [Ramlibacter humi]TFZ03540.1 type II secretion system protein N [Ramlibacter humi]
MARRIAPAASAPWLWAALGGLVGLVLAWVLALPAPWLANQVGQASGGQVQLQDARGTVWNGSAQLVLSGGAGSHDATALPTRLSWRLRPAWGGLHVELSTECCIPTPVALEWRPRWHGASLRVGDGQSQWPAAILSGLGTPWNTLQLDGDLALQTTALALDWAEGRFTMAGGAQLTAQRLASRISTLRPLGSYRVDLTGGASPRVQLSTLEGALQLKGNGQWVGQRLRFTGEASAAPDREAALANLLNIIGRRNGARSIITIG